MEISVLTLWGTIFFIADNNGKYKATRVLTEKQIFSAGKALLKKKFTRGCTLNGPGIVRYHLMYQYADYEHEVFVDNQHRIIKEEVMFRGTIDTAIVYPREVVKKALQLNAAAVIFAHNHPSGNPDPSQADKEITKKLKQALNLIDVRVLDHFIIAHTDSFSFSEHGLIWLNLAKDQKSRLIMPVFYA